MLRTQSCLLRPCCPVGPPSVQGEGASETQQAADTALGLGPTVLLGLLPTDARVSVGKGSDHRGIWYIYNVADQERPKRRTRPRQAHTDRCSALDVR